MKLTDKKILIIDDDLDYCRIVDKILSNVGVQVKIANNLVSGIESLKIEIPDLVILDINLPDYDGYSLLKLRKKSDKIRFLPFLIISAGLSRQRINEAALLGIDQYIEKPISSTILIQKIRQILLSTSEKTILVSSSQKSAVCEVPAIARECCEEAMVVDSLVKLKINSFFKIKISYLQEEFVCQVKRQINSIGTEFYEHIVKFCGVGEDSSKKINEWRKASLGKGKR